MPAVEGCGLVCFVAELQGLPKQPPLELAIAHARQCVQHMSTASLASCAFTNISDYL